MVTANVLSTFTLDSKSKRARGFNFTLHLRIASFVGKIMDDYALDPLLGFIPVVGDVTSVVFSYYLVWIAKSAKVPQKDINKMIRNIVTDFIIGIIPVVGDAADFIYKANKKNLAILHEHAKRGVVEGEVVS